MNTVEVFFLGVCGGGGGDESPRWGHSPRVEGRGMRALSQILSDESLSYSLEPISTGGTHFTFHGGALISYISISCFHDDVIKWKHVTSLAFVRGIHWWLRAIHRSPVNSPYTDQWRGALMFSLICAWTNGWVNNQDAGELKCHRTHYDVTVMWCRIVIQWSSQPWDLSAFNASLLSNFPVNW